MRSNVSGWLIVAVCFLALSVVYSARSLLGLTMPLWEQELGWSRSFVSSGGAVALVVMAVAAPIAGNLIDRLGPRRPILWGLVTVAVSMGLTATARAEWEFILYFGILGGIGFGVVAIHAVSTIVALEFPVRAGLPTGVATAGSTAGQLLIIPLLAIVLTAIGWRVSYAVLGVASIFLIALLLYLVRPDAESLAARAKVTRDVPQQPPEPFPERLGALAKSRVFHALFWSFVICGFTTTGIIELHLLPYAAACGFPPLTGATAYGVLAAFNMIGMVMAGYLADRVHRPILLASIYFFRGLAFILLFYIVGNTPMLFIFAVMFGVFDYSTVPITASLVASHIGLRVMGLSMGILMAGHSLGAAVAAFLGGYLFDLFASYDWVWILAIVTAVSAAFICLTIPERRGTVAQEAAVFA
ncbi:MAG: MFS transporter [Rhodospirillales bacterium]|jgi:MFS family permease|nr:MFS transporter [Rhodospirillales bacterium]MDP6773830.1 MFS transporter [Rhodospirillales bacterium]